MKRGRNRGGRRNAANFSYTLRAIASDFVGHLDENHVYLGHVLRGDDAQIPQGQRMRHAASGREVLGKRVSESHVYAPLHLFGAEPWVDGATDVVRRDDALDAALVVQDHQLSRIAECQMGRGVEDGFGRAGAGGESQHVLAVILAPDQLLECVFIVGRAFTARLARREAAPYGFQICCQLARCLARRRTTERGSPGGPRLAALVAQLVVPLDRHHARREPRFLAHSLHRRREDTLPHLGIAVEDLEPGAFNDPNLDVAAFHGTVAETGTLDAAPDTFVPGALVHVSDGLERRLHAAYALAH